jgi:hypothetical protein
MLSSKRQQVESSAIFSLLSHKFVRKKINHVENEVRSETE